LIGETLGQRYSIVRLLGQGGMGSVYEATDQETRERVAVKVLHRHIVGEGGLGARRFRREAEAARSIKSDHIVRGLDAGVDEATGLLYLVTEHLDGEDLQQILDRTGPLSPEGALLIAAQALSGLSDAHAAGIVHRDIKPANMILARRPGGERTVKLLDLGLAKFKPDPGSPSASADLTTTGSFLGSPLYMSPEQVQNSRDVDHRSDLWSLGCALYAALAGRAPHQHITTFGKLLVAICVSPPPPLSQVAPWVPLEIAAIVHRALSLQPEARFPSARAMQSAIHAILPPGALTEAKLAPLRERPPAVIASRTHPTPAPLSPRVVVTPNLERPLLGVERPLRGDEPTEVVAGGAALLDRAWDTTTRDSSRRTALGEGDPHPSARSGVPILGEGVAGPHITVDPRRLLGEASELWTFSLNVHRNVSSLVSRIWKSLRRAGAPLPPRTYGTAWVLFEPRTGKALMEAGGEDAWRLSLEDAGIRPGTVLWVMPPEGEARAPRVAEEQSG
jgi:serine/threonine-protein kinase